MAKNLKQYDARYVSGAATDPATPTSGSPVVIGQVPGVALTDEGDGGNATGEVTISRCGMFSMSVVGEDGAGNTDIGIGDILYLDAGVLNADDTNGVRWGYAWGVVASGATTTIDTIVGY